MSSKKTPLLSTVYWISGEEKEKRVPPEGSHLILS